VLVPAAVAIVVGLAALLATVGSDAQWLAALGHSIVAHDAIPKGVPFAVAPTGHWPNVLVLAELIFEGLEAALGDRGLMLAQLLAAAFALWMLARDAGDGGAEPAGIAGCAPARGSGSAAEPGHRSGAGFLDRPLSRPDRAAPGRGPPAEDRRGPAAI